jgi:hypothetical protein
MTSIIKNYSILSDDKKCELLTELYLKQKQSWATIAKTLNTYPNRLMRDAAKYALQSRGKSEAQKTALVSGRIKHPTAGTKRSSNVKYKISESMANVWSNLKPEERESRVQQARDQWNNMSDIEKEAFHRASHMAILQAAKEGSKLEKFLYQELTKANYHIEFHKSHLILNERLHLDLFLPIIKVAIEVDGPSHFTPIWGLKVLQRNQKSDMEKAGLILSKDLILIRIKHTKTLSAKYKRDILTSLMYTLKEVEKKFPSREGRYITIGE